MRNTVLILAGLVATTLIDTLSAQTARYRITGSSCTTGRISNLGPVPFGVLGVPRIGSSFRIVTEGTASYPWGNRRTVVLFTGLSNTSIAGVRLPLDISTLIPGRFCGLLRTSMEWSTPVPRVGDYRTPAQVIFTVPNQPSLAGVRFFQQVWSTEWTSFGPPFRSGALSAGGEATVGF